MVATPASCAAEVATASKNKTSNSQASPAHRKHEEEGGGGEVEQCLVWSTDKRMILSCFACQRHAAGYGTHKAGRRAGAGSSAAAQVGGCAVTAQQAQPPPAMAYVELRAAVRLLRAQVAIDVGDVQGKVVYVDAGGKPAVPGGAASRQLAPTAAPEYVRGRQEVP